MPNYSIIALVARWAVGAAVAVVVAPLQGVGGSLHLEAWITSNSTTGGALADSRNNAISIHLHSILHPWCALERLLALESD